MATSTHALGDPAHVIASTAAPAPVHAAETASALATRLGRALLPWAVPLGLLLLWEITCRSGWVPHRILPAPSQVVAAGWALSVSGELPRHLLASLERGLGSLLLGGGLGLVLGLLAGLFRSGELLIDTSMQMLRNVPPVAVIPIAILWFGIGESCKLFIMVLGAFFPLYITAFNGIRAIDPKLVEVGRIYGLGRMALVRHALLPSALPQLLVGLRLALGLMWINLIVAESFATPLGLGYLVNNAREFMQTDIIVLGIVIYALLGKLADALTRAIERRALAWNAGFKGL
jgi:sulfonate transport system permease protein